jgi:hypothetical protein
VPLQVDVRADKKKIKQAVQGLYEIQTKKINTLIRCVFGFVGVFSAAGCLRGGGVMHVVSARKE